MSTLLRAEIEAHTHRCRFSISSLVSGLVHTAWFERTIAFPDIVIGRCTPLGTEILFSSLLFSIFESLADR
jgi:hypothetical protein